MQEMCLEYLVTMCRRSCLPNVFPMSLLAVVVVVVVVDLVDLVAGV